MKATIARGSIWVGHILKVGAGSLTISNFGLVEQKLENAENVIRAVTFFTELKPMQMAMSGGGEGEGRAKTNWNISEKRILEKSHVVL